MNKSSIILLIIITMLFSSCQIKKEEVNQEPKEASDTVKLIEETKQDDSTKEQVEVKESLIKPDNTVFIVENGMVFVEIESVAPTGDWVEETDMEGYTGNSYYTWRGANYFNKPGNGILTYKIEISEPGYYHFAIRNRHDFKDSSEQNDVFVKVDDKPWTKTFSSTRGAWTFHTAYEFSHDDKPLAYNMFEKGIHTIMICGRSYGFSIDRFTFYKADGPDGRLSSMKESNTKIVKE